MSRRDRVTVRSSAGSCSSGEDACPEAAGGRKLARSSVMARPWAARSSLKFGAASWHSRAAARQLWPKCAKRLASVQSGVENPVHSRFFIRLNYKEFDY